MHLNGFFFNLILILILIFPLLLDALYITYNNPFPTKLVGYKWKLKLVDNFERQEKKKEKT
jgi:hypothetical protein